MVDDKKKQADDELPRADTGHASNPSPKEETSAGPEQLIDKKGEKYLRESGNIEDYPDPEENR